MLRSDQNTASCKVAGVTSQALLGAALARLHRAGALESLMTACTCGEAHPHVAARRITADGAHVEVWSDGAVTAPLGMGFDGIPVARPRTDDAINRQRRIGWMFAAWASVYDRDELPTWYRACRDAVRRGGDERMAKEILRDLRRPRVSVVWTVVRADRDGRPTERQVRLPRLRWPGMAVVDRCRGPLRYSVVYIIPGTDTIKPYSGLDFATWAEVEAHLHTVGACGGLVRPAF